MPPGAYVPDSTEGITRIQDLPRPLLGACPLGRGAAELWRSFCTVRPFAAPYRRRLRRWGQSRQQRDAEGRR